MKMSKEINAKCPWLDGNGCCTRQACALASLKRTETNKNNPLQFDPEYLNNMINQLPSQAYLDDDEQIICLVADNPKLQKTCSGYITIPKTNSH